MKTFTNLASIPDLPRPTSLAIGTFDGVHLGHRLLINTMKQYGTAVVFTFPNHPREVISPEVKVPRLTAPEYKLELLEGAGVDFCLMQPFTKDMSGMTYNLFLEEVHSALPFDHLFFGEGDAMGKNREGTKEALKPLQEKLGFETHYLPKLTIDQEVVSSRTIRKLLLKGDLKQAEKFLGRKFATKTTLEYPQVDPELLKPSHYNCKICVHGRVYECDGKVDKEGAITLDYAPSDPAETATIIFEKE